MNALPLIAAISGLALFAGGFALGVWTYSHVYAHFLIRTEQAFQAKLVRVTQQAQLGKKALEERITRLREMYDNGIGKRDQTDVDEAVQESILGSGPGERG